ncbi:hypothetical protein [Phormidesmis sp. 146-33]
MSLHLLPDFFESCLNSICQHYAHWWQVYTRTDVVGCDRQKTAP